MLVEVEVKLLERNAGLDDDLEVPVVQLYDPIHLGHVDADGVATLQIFALVASGVSSGGPLTHSNNPLLRAWGSSGQSVEVTLHA